MAVGTASGRRARNWQRQQESQVWTIGPVILPGSSRLEESRDHDGVVERADANHVAPRALRAQARHDTVSKAPERLRHRRCRKLSVTSVGACGVAPLAQVPVSEKAAAPIACGLPDATYDEECVLRSSTWPRRDVAQQTAGGVGTPTPECDRSSSQLDESSLDSNGRVVGIRGRLLNAQIAEAAVEYSEILGELAATRTVKASGDSHALEVRIHV